MKCECGHHLATNVPRYMACICGRAHFVDSEAEPVPTALGDCLRQVAPSLFVDCTTCKVKDALGLVNIWGAEKSIENAGFIARLLEQPHERIAEAIQHASDIRAAMPINVSRFAARPMDDMRKVRVVTFHFNPCRYRRLRKTYYRWLPSVSRLDPICYELVFDDDKPEIEGSRVIRAKRSEALMFQKESIINLALRECPASVRYFAWLDHDIILTDPDWLSHSVDLLKQRNVAVQLFQSVGLLDRHDVLQRYIVGAAANGGRRAPGGAWIAKRSFLQRIRGLYPFNIVGGGDSIFFSALCDDEARYLHRHSGEYRRHVAKWIRRTTKAMGNRGYAHLPATAYHLFHGEMKNRQYVKRENILIANGYSQADVRIGASGLLEWANDKPELHAAVRRWFEGRKEDC